jgi:hypothetical protein
MSKKMSLIIVASALLFSILACKASGLTSQAVSLKKIAPIPPSSCQTVRAPELDQTGAGGKVGLYYPGQIDPVLFNPDSTETNNSFDRTSSSEVYRVQANNAGWFYWKTQSGITYVRIVNTDGVAGWTPMNKGKFVTCDATW